MKPGGGVKNIFEQQCRGKTKLWWYPQRQYRIYIYIYISHVAYNWCFQIHFVISHRDQVATTNHVR